MKKFMDFQNIAIILPAYNEEKNIGNVLRRLSRWKKNVIVVDDGSTDGTYMQVLKEHVKVLRHIVNLGKGIALKTGIDYVLQHGFTKIVLMDADGQHDADNLKVILEKLENYDLVLGYRKSSFAAGGLRFIGNRIESWLIKIMYGKYVRDPLCGYRAFKGKIYKQIEWESSGYGVETEMIVKAIKRNINYAEVPVSLIYHDKYKGVSILDGYKFIWDMVKWRLTK